MFNHLTEIMSLRIENIKCNLLRISMLSVLVLIPLLSGAQPEKKYIRQGNREYGKEKFQESEVSYRRAVDGNNRSADAVFNIGDALYKQKKYEEAAKHFSENTDMNDNPERKSAGLFNLGNSLLQAKKIKESIEAYKGSLKLDPDNFEAKYNLAYAQDLLREQQKQEQQQQQQQDNKNQDKQENKNDQNQQKEDQKKQDEKQDQQQQQQQQQSISKEDAQRLLNSLANDEKNVQEKVKLAKAVKERKLTVKNW
jgi:Ca-activated chloride channel homolog